MATERNAKYGIVYTIKKLHKSRIQNYKIEAMQTVQHILQGSVATQLKCGGIDYLIIA